MPLILFRADASAEIGSGHVMRCLTLAAELRAAGADILFLCRELPGDLCALIEQRGMPLQRLPMRPHLFQDTDAQDCLAALAGRTADWLVVDHYGLDASWERAMAGAARRILAIDDLADRAHACQLLLDQNIVAEADQRYRPLLPAACGLLIGPRYALLQPAYAGLHRRLPLRTGPVKRLLVSFGGADADNLTGRSLEAILGLPEALRAVLAVDIVLPGAGLYNDELRRQATGQAGIVLHHRLPSLAGLMAQADLALGAGGTTTWERLCLGLPALVVTIAENQRAITAEVERRGLVRWLGDAADVDAAALAKALRDCLQKDLPADWSQACHAAVDGLGARRVAGMLLAAPGMPLAVRHAEPRDEALLLAWANDPLTRSTAFSPEQIPAATHHAWFHKRLRAVNSVQLFIVEDGNGEGLGTVRFERLEAEGEWEVHYALAPAFRGRALGQSMLAAALDAMRGVAPGARILGQVKPENTPSTRIFENLEFARISAPDAAILRFTRVL